MTFQDILPIVERRVAQDLEDRRDAFKREIAQLRETLSGKGLLPSSVAVSRISKAIGNEFRVRVSLIWRAFEDALDARQIILTKSTGSDIKLSIADMLERHSSDLSAHFQRLGEAVRVASSSNTITDLRAAALDRIYTEIDYASLRQSSVPEPAANVVIQNCGIVQTGMSSSVSLSITISTEERHEIQAAVNASREALQSAAALRPEERDQALKLATDVENEIQRDRPNHLRICGALQGLATTIQTIAVAPQAYQLLKGAAALVGLQLP